MSRDFSAGSIARRENLGNLCDVWRMSASRSRVSPILPRDKYRGYGGPGNSRNLRSRVAISLLPLPHRSASAFSLCCVVGSPFFRAYFRVLFHQASPPLSSISRSFISSALPLLASVVIVGEKYSDAQWCAISGEIDLSSSNLIDIKSLFIHVCFSLIRHCFRALNGIN